MGEGGGKVWNPLGGDTHTPAYSGDIAGGQHEPVTPNNRQGVGTERGEGPRGGRGGRGEPSRIGETKLFEITVRLFTVCGFDVIFNDLVLFL